LVIEMKRAASKIDGPFKPPNKEVLKKDYERKFPSYEQLAEEVHFMLSTIINPEKIQVSTIEPRVKDFEKFYDKILRKQIVGNPFEHIDDVAGVRVTCLYRSDLDVIGELISRSFSVIRKQIPRKETRMPFGYLSDHYIIKLPKHCSGARYDSIKSLKCEIQVRTVAMHAWTTVSHHLDYKQEIDIPSKLKGDFNALSGVFYIADTLFEQFREAREDAIKRMTDVEKDQFNLDNELNLDTLKAFLAWKFPTRKKSQLRSVLLNEIAKHFKTNYRELDRLVKKHESSFLKDEGTSKEKGDIPYFSDVGAMRGILERENPELAKKLWLSRTYNVRRKKGKRMTSQSQGEGN